MDGTCIVEKICNPSTRIEVLSVNPSPTKFLLNPIKGSPEKELSPLSAPSYGGCGFSEWSSLTCTSAWLCCLLQTCLSLYFQFSGVRVYHICDSVCDETRSYNVALA